LSIEWVCLIDTYYPGLGILIATNILTSIWQAVLRMWKERVAKIHCDDPTENRIRNSLKPRVDAIYKKR
jgi:hypothetical protein